MRIARGYELRLKVHFWIIVIAIKDMCDGTFGADNFFFTWCDPSKCYLCVANQLLERAGVHLLEKKNEIEYCNVRHFMGGGFIKIALFYERLIVISIVRYTRYVW